jgi:hypothetical protein
MKKVAQAINAFPIEEPPSSNAAAVLVPLDTLEAILQGIKSLNQEVQGIKKRLEGLEALEEIYHGPTPSTEDLPFIRNYWDVKRDEIKDLPMIVKAIDEDLSSLEKEVRCKELKSPGKKTDARINKLKGLLKGYGGSQTFKQLQSDLDLSPSQFSQLVDKLDKRVFEISPRPRGKKGEKVLKLKARIREPLMVK